MLFNKYDVIHLHFGLSGLFLLFNPFIKTPVITMLHSADIDKRKSTPLIIYLTKKVIRKSNHIFYLNLDMKNLISNYSSSMTYLPCGVKDDVFNNERQHKDKEMPYIIGFPGNTKRPEKNYSLFEKIINLVKTKYGFEILIEEFHNKTRDEVAASLNKIDVLLMTSISEGSPQIVKEAMCCNTPIISTNVGDVQVLLKDVDNCSVIDSYEPEDFVTPLYELLSSKQNIRSNGRDKIFQLGLDTKSTSYKIMDCYRNLAKL
ncbi:MAG: glycosyltransferase [Prolixibacteraceae bacterium]|nr:glycosyltransferase [Prolixibacteraceae bacterium]